MPVLARRHTLALALALLAGCGDKGDGTDDTGAPGDDTGGSGLSELTSVWEGHDEAYCDDSEFSDQPGAVTYFLGEYEKKGETWEGTEYWLLYANDAWAEADSGVDCQIAWTVQLSETDVSTCSVCDYGLAGGATIDLSKTTCGQEGLWEGLENQTLSYDVDDTGTTATFYFATSGNYLGAGYSNGGGALNYLSDPQCDWF